MTATPDTPGSSDTVEQTDPAAVEPESTTEETVLEEIERIDPVITSGEVTLTTGQTVFLQRLKTRQFFAMLRIITRGSGVMLRHVNLDPASQTTEEFTTSLVALLLTAVPEADDETIEFLATMVKPKVDFGEDGPVAGPKRMAEKQALEEAAWKQLNETLANPELDDTLSLIEGIVRREAGDLKALGKRIVKMWEVARKTGQTKELETEPTIGQGA
jgi:hypothetical protein